MLWWAFHCPRKPPFSWFAWAIAWAWAIACMSCQGLPQVNHTIWINPALINKDKGVAQVRGALIVFLGIKHCFTSPLDPALNFKVNNGTFK